VDRQFFPDDGRKQIPDDDGEQTRFYPPRFTLLLMAGGAALFAGIGYRFSLSSMTWLVWFGWVFLVAFSAAALVLLARALRPGPTLVLTAEGVFDRTTLAPTGLVRWDEIAAVRKREIGRGRGSERLLEVVLDDPEEFQARPRSPLRRLADRYRRAMKHPDVSIPGSMVSGPIQGVIDALLRRRPELQILDLPAELPKLRLFKQGPMRQHPRPPRW
jgi:hypothetical protein